MTSLATMYTELSMNNNKITNVATPTLNTDVTNKLYVDNAMPVGAIIMWYSVLPPTGYLVCNGASFSNITYPQLATVLGSTTLPDLRGVFTRGYDPTATRDPDGVSRAIGSI